MIGNGRIKFRKDTWLRTFPLYEWFLNVYALVVSNKAWIRDYWNHPGTRGGWSPIFIRPFNDWKV